MIIREATNAKTAVVSVYLKVSQEVGWLNSY